MTTQPFTDHNSRAAIDDATAALSADRADEWAGDITVEIHILASLRLQLDDDLRSAINTARHCGYRSHHVAELLGVTTDQAHRRYNSDPNPQPAHRASHDRQHMLGNTAAESVPGRRSSKHATEPVTTKTSPPNEPAHAHTYSSQ